jgi:hypothetical protein
MKKTSTVFLQIVILLIGIGILAALLWEPWLEGVNAHATSFTQIYFDDPFLAFVYTMTIPFFIGLYQAIRLLGLVGKNQVFSLAAVKAMRTIKYCALITASAIIAVDAYLMLHARLNPQLAATDDPAGAVALGLMATFASLIVATAAAVFQRILQNAVDIKSENDLTV